MTPVYITNYVSGRPVMSLTRTVAAMVIERGSATIDELMPDIQGYTRQQVMYALINARAEQLLHCEGHVKGRGAARSGSIPARHYPGIRAGVAPKAPRQRKTEIQTRPPNSVWEFGHGLQIAGEWPPRSAEGRHYSPLGGWDEATNDNRSAV